MLLFALTLVGAHALIGGTRQCARSAIAVSLASTPVASVEASSVEESAPVDEFSGILTQWPTAAAALATRGCVKPTAIQRAALPVLSLGKSALLAAETGSGKSLAFLLPTLSRLAPRPTDGGPRESVVVLAPTRELALQLAADATALLGPDEVVALMVVGSATSAATIKDAACIVATPKEAMTTFVAYPTQLAAKLEAVRAIVLDEVDALLPAKKKDYRSAATKQRATTAGKKKVKPESREEAPDAASAVQLLLRANARRDLQVVGASATASRSTRDSLRSVLRLDPYGRWADVGEGSEALEMVRAASSELLEEDAQAAPRAVVVPSAVSHRYLAMEKGSSERAVMAVVADALRRRKPRSALVFLSEGSGFKVSTSLEHLREAGASRAAALHQALALDKRAMADATRADATAAARTAPLDSAALARGHAELAARFTTDFVDDDTPVLVTFEASARGLHFDAVDLVFVIGAPNSAASYLHLAGRTGRRLGDATQPGTVVTVCPVKNVQILHSWSKQLGGVAFEPLFEDSTLAAPLAASA